MSHCLTTQDFKALIYTGPQQLADIPSLPALISAGKAATRCVTVEVCFGVVQQLEIHIIIT